MWVVHFTDKNGKATVSVCQSRDAASKARAGCGSSAVAWLRARCLAYGPDLVVWQLGTNDVAWGGRADGARGSRGRGRSPPLRSPRPYLHRPRALAPAIHTAGRLTTRDVFLLLAGAPLNPLGCCVRARPAPTIASAR